MQNRNRIGYLLLALLLAFCPMPVQAQKNSRPIVYAARYYSPPSRPKEKTYSHLYRINPDGSGKRQLTFAKAADVLPRWSPNGKKILFYRNSTRAKLVVYVISENGGKAKKIPPPPDKPEFWVTGAEWLDNRTIRFCGNFTDRREFVFDIRTGKYTRPVPSYYFSLDGKYKFQQVFNGKQEIVRVQDGQSHSFEEVALFAIWRNNSLLLGIPFRPDAGEHTTDTLLLFDRRGKVVRRIKTKPSSRSKQAFLNDSYGWPRPEFNYLSLLPDGRVLVGSDEAGQSWTGPLHAYYIVNLQTGLLDKLGEGSDLHWSPGGRRFITTMGLELSSYGRRLGKQGSKKVTVCSLRIGNVSSPNRQRQLVSGLVRVGGCDWRGGSMTK